VIGFLRFVGVANAAVWFGASIFFTFGVAPAFFSEPMLRLFGGANLELGRAYAGEAAQIIIARYFNLHLVCGILALLHLGAEWVYMGKPLQRLTLWLLLGIFTLGLAGGCVIQPKLRGFHRRMVDRSAAPQQSAEARHSFNAWHGASQVLNLAVLAGITVYLWRATTPGSGYRYRA
jgi:hypothetical protein